MKLKLPQAFRSKLAVNPRMYVKGKHKGGSNFVPGNQLSTIENLSAEAHAAKMSAMYQGWKTRVQKSKGIKVLSVEQKKKREMRKRVKLQETVAREAREIQDMARMAAEEAMLCLQAIMLSPDTRPSDKISAINTILDRAYGKATQTNVNANVDANGKEADISAAELQRRVEKALNRIETIAGGDGEARASQDRPPDVREYDRDPNSSTKH